MVQEALSSLFNIIDINHNGLIDIEELVFGLLTFAEGTPDDKIKAAFILFDTDDSMTLDRSELTNYFRYTLKMLKFKDSKKDYTENQLNR